MKVQSMLSNMVMGDVPMVTYPNDGQVTMVYTVVCCGY